MFLIFLAQNSIMAKLKYSKKVSNTKKRENLFSVLAGALAGLANGLFGGGGGMIVVPMLTSLLKVEPKKAHATAIFIILPLSLLSGLLYTAFGNLNLQIGIPVGLGVVLGGALGALLLSKLSSKWVVIIFAVVMAIAGGKMLFF